MYEERNTTDTELLEMEWPDAEQYETLGAYNARTGRELDLVRYERLRKLTNAPDPKPRTSRKDTLACVAHLLSAERRNLSEEWSR